MKMDDLAEIHLIGCSRKASLRIAVKVSSLQAFTYEEIIRRQSFERAESKCKDSEEASETGLEGKQFVSALAYAGNEGWVTDAPRRGWASLTSAGESVT
jgi:hypothetical protein